MYAFMHSPTTAAFRGRGARLEEKLLTVVREARKILKKGQKEVDDIMYPVNRARRKIHMLNHNFIRYMPVSVHKSKVRAHPTHWLICAQAGLFRSVPRPLHVLRRLWHRGKLRIDFALRKLLRPLRALHGQLLGLVDRSSRRRHGHWCGLSLFRRRS